MRSSAANLPKLLVPALGMAFLWPYFRASFLSFLQVFAVHPSPAIHAAYTAYALAFMLLAVAAVPMARHLARWLDSRFAPVALGALGSLGNALLWVGETPPSPRRSAWRDRSRPPRSLPARRCATAFGSPAGAAARQP